MKLLIASGDATPAAGDQGAFAQFLECFSTHWDRIDILAPPRKGAEDCTLFGNVHFHVGTLPRWRHPSFIKNRGGALLDEHRHDLILSHDHGLFYDSRTVVRLGEDRKIPVISEIHHVMGYPRCADLLDHLRYYTARFYVDWAKRRVAAFRVVNAAAMPELLVRWGVPPSKIKTLYSFYLDHTLFRPVPAEKKYDAIYCGRLAANKGIFLILRAAQRIVKRRPDFKIVLLGRGELEEKIKRFVESKNLEANVEMIRWVEGPEDVARLYNESRLSVCASFHEGGPRVTLEAMACALPVVSTPVGIMTEVIDPGENGFFSEWTPQDLADKMEAVLKDPATTRRMGKSARGAVRRFDRKNIIDQNALSYQNIAKKWRTCQKTGEPR